MALVGRLAVRRHIVLASLVMISRASASVLLLWLWPYISGLSGTVHFDPRRHLTSWF